MGYLNIRDILLAKEIKTSDIQGLVGIKYKKIFTKGQFNCIKNNLRYIFNFKCHQKLHKPEGFNENV